MGTFQPLCGSCGASLIAYLSSPAGFGCLRHCCGFPMLTPRGEGYRTPGCGASHGGEQTPARGLSAPAVRKRQERCHVDRDKELRPGAVSAWTNAVQRTKKQTSGWASSFPFLFVSSPAPLALAPSSSSPASPPSQFPLPSSITLSSPLSFSSKETIMIVDLLRDLLEQRHQHQLRETLLILRAVPFHRKKWEWRATAP